jgi:hypothetical protein
MPTAQTTTPQQVCENILIGEKRYNTERSILRSENAIIDRLLTRGLELKSAYGELYEKLHSRPPALRVLLGLLLSSANDVGKYHLNGKTAEPQLPHEPHNRAT